MNMINKGMATTFKGFNTIGNVRAPYSLFDLELVKRGEVKPQSLITSSACIGLESRTFQQPQNDNQLYEMFYYWCDGNKVADYGIDYKQPKYRLGRAKLGELQNETWESVITKIEEFPFISNIKVWEE